MMSTHSDTTLRTESSHKQLASIPLSAWEDELPALDLIIRETIRLASSSTFLRRNMKTELDADGVHIAKGDFVAYLAADVHLDENIYPNPGTFDPGRFEDGRSEGKNSYCGYVGWGAGRISLYLSLIPVFLTQNPRSAPMRRDADGKIGGETRCRHALSGI